MDCLHGIMMHGDDKVGMDHSSEDKKQKINAEKRYEGKEAGPCEGMDCMHGVLMHGDKEPGDRHSHVKQGPVKEPKRAGPCEGMDCLHGVLMHGDSSDGDTHKKEDEAKKATASSRQPRGPCTGMDCMHGVLMHGDQKLGADHTSKHKEMQRLKFQNAHARFTVEDPESLMHTDEDGANPHDTKKIQQKQKLNHEKTTRIPGVQDPDYLLHGHDERLAHERNKEKNDGWFFGYSFPFISDSIMNKIDHMKRRYVPKFWGTSQESETPTQAEVKRKANDAETAPVRHDDMRHELEGVGSVASINIKHKIAKDARKKDSLMRKRDET